MNVTEDGEKHSMIWGMFMTVTMESAVFMGKNYADNQHSIKNILKISQWNKCSTYLQDWCLNKRRSLDWKHLVGIISHGNTCLWLVKKEPSIFNTRGPGVPLGIAVLTGPGGEASLHSSPWAWTCQTWSHALQTSRMACRWQCTHLSRCFPEQLSSFFRQLVRCVPRVNGKFTQFFEFDKHLYPH